MVAPSVLFRNFCSKGEEGKLHQLKASRACGDSDNGQAVDDSADQAEQRDLPTAEHRPNNVCNGVRPHVQIHLFPKGEEGESRNLKALYSEGDSDDGDTEKNTADTPEQRQPYAAQEHPYKIRNRLHISLPYGNRRS